MKARLKDCITSLYRHLFKKAWPNNGLVNVGILCDENFLEEEWEKIIESEAGEIKKHCNLKFIFTKWERRALAGKVEVLFSNWIDRYYLMRAPCLKWVYLCQSDNMADNDLRQFPVQITTAKGLAAGYIAEYVLAMSIMLVKNFDKLPFNQRRSIWTQHLLFNDTSRVERVTVGVYGCGKNGIAIARLCKQAGFKVVAFDKRGTIDPGLGIELFSTNQFERFLNRTNILVVSIPLTRATENSITSRELKLLKKPSSVINISRPAIVNLRDLRIALNSHIIKNAAIDILECEPPGFFAVPRARNLIITPHMAGNIALIRDEIQRDFIQKLKVYLSAKKIDDPEGYDGTYG